MLVDRKDCSIFFETVKQDMGATVHSHITREHLWHARSWGQREVSRGSTSLHKFQCCRESAVIKVWSMLREYRERHPAVWE